MKNILGLLVCIVSGLAHALDKLPSGCSQLTVQENDLQLVAKKPTVFLLYNQSMQNIWLTHPSNKASMSAGWSSPLDAGKWSAFFTDKPTFELSCVESKPGHEQQVPCANLIIACTWNTMQIPAQNKGAFWIAENYDQDALLSYMGNHDYPLPE